jgi:hypothetical protein
MSGADLPTPSKAAYRLTHILNVFATAHAQARFPVAVEPLAKEAAGLFGWDDPITEVRAENMRGFEGALIGDHGRRWLLLYNDGLASLGRIRFTQAHELGHYLLHRTTQSVFQCTERDMTDWSDDAVRIEAAADEFASSILMPLDDFRQQASGGTGCFNMLGTCAERYGVSLTAAALRWVQCTELPAILVVHRDGFMDWAFSSRAAMRAGAFFRTKQAPVAIPPGCLASDDRVSNERGGRTLDARVWFPHAATGVTVRECKVTADRYDSIMTLLVLPTGETVWAP